MRDRSPSVRRLSLLPFAPQNLHLVVGWLSVLEKELAALKPHARFRLWLTTECHGAFPPVLLQQSLKVTFEAP